MIAVSLTADRDTEAGLALYRLAGEDALLSGHWPQLSSFRRGNGARRSRPVRLPSTPFGALRYQGPAVAANPTPLLTCLQGEEGYLLRASPGATLWVAGDGAHITQCEPAGESPAAVSPELLFGPAMLLALALRGTFAFHASAVRWGDRVVAFVGPSGAGKSTLASLLSALDLGCERVADDILPFAVAAGAAAAKPAFPQLKLDADQQWADPRVESLPLAAVYLLAPPSSDPTPRTVPLRGAAALATLTTHSVASPLFGPELLGRHLDALASASRMLRTAELHYPRRPESAAQIHGLLRRDLDD